MAAILALSEIEQGKNTLKIHEAKQKSLFYLQDKSFMCACVQP